VGARSSCAALACAQSGHAADLNRMSQAVTPLSQIDWGTDHKPEIVPAAAAAACRAGFAYAPLLATRLVCGRLARPAAVVGAAVAAVRGVLRFVNLRGLSPANLLKQLQEAAISFGGDCLEVSVCVCTVGVCVLGGGGGVCMPDACCRVLRRCTGPHTAH
jgi:hypothetical protein